MSDQSADVMISRTREEYQTLADQYDDSFETIPYRTHVEEYSTVRAIQAFGGVTGRTVLDVACGTGHYTRLLRHQGAARVVGVDLSPEMLQIAQQAESAAPMGGISYEVQDIGELNLPETFDLAVGVYLLHYSPTQTYLQQICQGIARHVRPGGHLVTCTINPDLCAAPNYYQKYNMNFFPPSQRRDGEQYSFAFRTRSGWIPPITVHYWSRKTIEQALQQAGFRDVQWHDFAVSAAGREQYGAEFWQDLLDCPPCVVVTGTKQ
jgi:ubiquinone/menaquinone biosynthesis C-methylase UbiE